MQHNDNNEEKLKIHAFLITASFELQELKKKEFGRLNKLVDGGLRIDDIRVRGKQELKERHQFLVITYLISECQKFLTNMNNNNMAPSFNDIHNILKEAKHSLQHNMMAESSMSSFFSKSSAAEILIDTLSKSATNAEALTLKATTPKKP